MDGSTPGGPDRLIKLRAELCGLHAAGAPLLAYLVTQPVSVVSGHAAPAGLAGPATSSLAAALDDDACTCGCWFELLYADPLVAYAAGVARLGEAADLAALGHCLWEYVELADRVPTCLTSEAAILAQWCTATVAAWPTAITHSLQGEAAAFVANPIVGERVVFDTELHAYLLLPVHGTSEVPPDPTARHWVAWGAPNVLGDLDAALVQIDDRQMTLAGVLAAHGVWPPLAAWRFFVIPAELHFATTAARFLVDCGPADPDDDATTAALAENLVGAGMPAASAIAAARLLGTPDLPAVQANA